MRILAFVPPHLDLASGVLCAARDAADGRRQRDRPSRARRSL